MTKKPYRLDPLKLRRAVDPTPLPLDEDLVPGRWVYRLAIWGVVAATLAGIGLLWLAVAYATGHTTKENDMGHDVAKLRDLIAAATPGPWWMTNDCEDNVWFGIAARHPTRDWDVKVASQDAFCARADGGGGGRRDAEAIVAIVNAAPEMLALDRLRPLEACRRIHDGHSPDWCDVHWRSVWSCIDAARAKGC